MEFGFKEILFGLAGVSMIAWAGVIGLWHTYMFPRFFKEDSNRMNNASPVTSSIAESQSAPTNKNSKKPWFIDDQGGSLTPQTAMGAIGLGDRGKYTKKSFVVADFNPIDSSYGVNRLYTSVLIGLAISTFVIITFGLQSGFGMMGPNL
tara:strand:+ start:117 stop:563 length:447 start_codon:yes stop_codon:yes gene_type:complete